jgi:hypothetical protein
MDLGLGRVKDDFQVLIERDVAAYAKGELSNWSYLGMSLYGENVERYKCLFKEQLLCLYFEDLLNGERTLDKVFDFLMLQNENSTLPHKNKSRGLKNKKILYYLKRTGLKPLFSSLISPGIKQSLFEKLGTENSVEIKLARGLQEELQKIVEKDKKSINF